VVTYASALFVSLTFFALVKRLGLATRPFEVVVTSQQAYRALTDATLNDDMKEAIMRQSAKTLGRQFVSISAASLAAFGAPLGVVWVLAAAGVVSLKAVVLALLSWQILFGSTLLVTARVWYERVRVHGAH
jgi:hypothetical protein